MIRFRSTFFLKYLTFFVKVENGHSVSTASLSSDSMDSLLDEDEGVDDVIVSAPIPSSLGGIFTSPQHKARIVLGGGHRPHSSIGLIPPDIYSRYRSLT